MKVAGAPISWGVSELEREASALAASSAEVLVPEDMETFLEMTQVDLCLDTGHVFLGGADPVAIARDAGARVRHVHLKDVDAELRRAVPGEEDLLCRGGAARPLQAAWPGRPRHRVGLRPAAAAGYRGWYVLEQDTALTAEPEPGAGPVAAARQSLEYFRHIASAKLSTSASKEE